MPLRLENIIKKAAAALSINELVIETSKIIRKLEIMAYTPECSSDNELQYAVEIILQMHDKTCDTLKQLYAEGPVMDDNVISKTERDWLIKNGYATRVIYHGLDGYTACTYKGRDAVIIM